MKNPQPTVPSVIYPGKQHLVTLEYFTPLGEVYLELYYFLTDHRGIRILSRVLLDDEYDRNPDETECPLELDDRIYEHRENLREELNQIIEQKIEYDRFIMGIPRLYRSSQFFTRSDWDRISLQWTKKTRTVFTSPFIEFLKENALNPRPFDHEKGMWTASCPRASHHPLMLNVFEEQFGCGWCKKKGGLQELKIWIAEIKKHRTSKP